MRIMGATGVDYRRWRPPTGYMPLPRSTVRGYNTPDETRKGRRKKIKRRRGFVEWDADRERCRTLVGLVSIDKRMIEYAFIFWIVWIVWIGGDFRDERDEIRGVNRGWEIFGLYVVSCFGGRMKLLWVTSILFYCTSLCIFFFFFFCAIIKNVQVFLTKLILVFIQTEKIIITFD